MPPALMGRVTSAIHSRTVFNRRVRVLAAHVAELVPHDARTILDVGCGDGTLAHSMLRHRADLQPSGLEIRARPTTAIPVREFDGRILPCVDSSYDVVMMIDVLHHAEEPLLLLGEAARVAKNAVIVKDHLADPWLGRLRLRAMDWVGNVGHGVPLQNGYWTRTEWQSAFVKVGLREAERRELLGLYPGPIRWLFEDGLHFVSRLDRDPAR